MNIELVKELTRKLALELMFAEPGKDNGLLPVNNLLQQIEELCQADPPPPVLRQAVCQGRQVVDHVFARDALFEAESLAGLREWNVWMDSALEALQRDQSLPELPASWVQGASPPAVPVETPASFCSPPVPAADQLKVESPPAPTAPALTASTAATASSDEEIPLVLNLEQDAELLREFVAESQEHLQNIELGVLGLEENPTDADTLASIFRAFHTFKGGSGFLRLTPVNRLAHELESLLDRARQGKLTITSHIINLILEGGDTLTLFVAEIQNAIALGYAGQVVIPTAALVARVRAAVAAPVGASSNRELPPARTPVARADPASRCEPMKVPDSSAGTLATAAAPTSKAKAAPAKPIGDAGIVKVDTNKLDCLLDLVGELVIAQSLVAQDNALQSLNSQRLNRNLAQLNGITRELQKLTMSLRMVPIRATFQKMHRLVRDLAAKQGKQAELQMTGEETELDRTITEEITDPLVHMIRNSVDHGIEKPEVRVAQGKAAQGTIFLRAFHQSGNIVVEVQDDGGGLNKDRMLAKAIEKGLVRPDEPLSEKEIFDLVFAPGFSTADKVTDISGRGVGMDVVRRNVEKLRGNIAIASTAGQGTTVTIALPLTLAIIDGFIVGVGQERFILPTYCVRESFRPTAQMLSTVYGRGEMVNVRGRLNPVLRLHEYFNVPAAASDPAQGILLLVECDGQHRCLLVDELLGKQEVVIKSLGETFKQNQAIAGAAILGDGRVGLILDVSALVKLKTAPLAKAA